MNDSNISNEPSWALFLGSPILCGILFVLHCLILTALAGLEGLVLGLILVFGGFLYVATLIKTFKALREIWRRFLLPRLSASPKSTRCLRLALNGAKLVVLAFLVATISHRIFLQFRPLPKHIVSQRAMTQDEYTKMFKTTNEVPINYLMTDSRPYSDSEEDTKLSMWDFLCIRTIPSWGSFMPYRTTAIDVWNKTNVSVQVYEHHAINLNFTKDSKGWHVKEISGQIDWAPGGEPILSFH